MTLIFGLVLLALLLWSFYEFCLVRTRCRVKTRQGFECVEPVRGRIFAHDHRHQDGSEDAVTQYGGDTPNAGSPTRQEFYADAHTAALIPAASTNIWTIEVTPTAFSYGLRREGTDRRFRVEFDLTTPVPAPPAPWGAQ